MNINGISLEPNKLAVTQTGAIDQTQGKSANESVIRELSVGDTITGKMISREGDSVQLMLSNDTVIEAKLAKDIPMQPGQLISFSVKANGQNGMALMPLFTNTSDMNTAAKALMNAGVAVNSNSMKMVSAMMEEGMPIGKDAILHMNRQASLFPTADVTNLVQMQRMGISITEENVEQFQNYKNYEHQINDATNHIATLVSDTFMEMLSEGNTTQAVSFYKDMVSLLVESDSQNANLHSLIDGIKEGAFTQEEMTTLLSEMENLESQSGSISPEMQALKETLQDALQQENLSGGGAYEAGSAVGEVANEHLKELYQQVLSEVKLENQSQQVKPLTEDQNLSLEKEAQNGEVSAKNSVGNSDVTLTGKPAVDADVMATLERLMKGVETVTKEEETIENNHASVKQTAEPSASPFTMTKEEMAELKDKLLESGIPKEAVEAFEKGELSGKALLSYVQKHMHSEESTLSLLKSTGFQKVIGKELSMQWKISPEQTSSKTEVKDLYKRIEEQTRQIMDALESSTKADTPLAKAVTNLQNNLDFMNQMNQMFPYVQLPLKMSGSDAHGELYVYTNKKNLAKNDGSVSALLHLDMEHLGTMDVYVKMDTSNQHVNTNFTLADEKALLLVEAHIDELTARLNKRGYQMATTCSIQTEETTAMAEMIQSGKNNAVISMTAFDARA